MILFLDESPIIDDRDELIVNLKEAGAAVIKIANAKRVPNGFKNGFLNGTKVGKLIYHYSRREGVAPQIANTVVIRLQELIGNAILIAVSSGSDEKSNASTLGIEIVKSYNELVNGIKGIKSELKCNWIEAFNYYCAKEKGKSKNRNFQEYLLPLDIDMQALAVLLKDKKKDKAIKYLKEMLDDTEENYYTNRLNEAISTKDGIKDEKKKKILDDLFNDHILNFMIKIDDLKRNRTKKVNYNCLISIINYFEKINKNGTSWKNINSFHDWYCKLASCLKA